MSKRVSRRGLFGGAAVTGVLLQAQAPAVITGTNAGRRFKAFVRYGMGAEVRTLKLRAIGPDEVLVRTAASTVCYTIVRGALGTNNAQRASIPNHSGMGVVEEVGARVRRVQKGDRVAVPGTPECGVCYQCLQGRADWCQFLATAPATAIADMEDGTPVYADGALGGLSELMVVPEPYTVPLWTDVPDAYIAMLGDTAGTGLAAGRNLVAIHPGADVVVLGAGPVGLGAMQAAKIAGATQIIVVEPIRVRRELALKLGATTVLDPNVEGLGLAEKIRELCKGPTDRRYAGGRAWGQEFIAVPRGPDFTIEAVGGDTMPPKLERGPDPTGVLPLQQAFDFTRGGGHIVMLGFAQQGNVTFPAMPFANRGRTFHSGQQGGIHIMRDIPRYVKLIERGMFDAKAMVTATYPLERTREAVQAVADRTQVGAVVTFA